MRKNGISDAELVAAFDARNYQQVLDWGYEKGDWLAGYYCGCILARGFGVVETNQAESDRIMAEIRDDIIREAQNGNVVAQSKLGLLYCEGIGFEKSYEKGVIWLRKAAERGDKYAQANLGNRYSEGTGVEQSDEEAVKWYRKAAEQGAVLAQYSLAMLYQRGRGVEQSNAEALKWFLAAAEQGTFPKAKLMARLVHRLVGVENFKLTPEQNELLYGAEPLVRNPGITIMCKKGCSIEKRQAIREYIKHILGISKMEVEVLAEDE